MKKETIYKAQALERKIDEYETVIRYAATNLLRFSGSIGTADLSEDKELTKLIYDHCKKKQQELEQQYEEL